MADITNSETDVSITSIASGVAFPVELAAPDPLSRNFILEYASNGGSIEMDVDGSVTPVVFTITADPTLDKILIRIGLWIRDSFIDLDKFGNEAALTNGFRIVQHVDGGADNVILDNVKNTKHLLQYSLERAYTFDYRMSQTTTPTAIVVYFATEGVVLRAGTADSLTATVSDNLLGLEEFRLIARGYKA